MNKGIKMSNCKFYVDENARTVVCVIPNKLGEYTFTKNMVSDFIEDNFKFNDFDMQFCMDYDWVDKALKMPSSFMGKAVCAPEDEWDEELGKMIAFSRAKDKCYKSFFKRANTFVQTMDRRLGDMIEAFNNFGMRLEDRRVGLQQQIEERNSKDIE